MRVRGFGWIVAGAALVLMVLAPPSLAHVQSGLRSRASWTYAGDLADGTGRIYAIVRLDVKNVSPKKWVDAQCTVMLDDSYYGVRYARHTFHSIRRWYLQTYRWSITTRRDLTVTVTHCHIPPS